jgi:hypothetical protein
MSKKNLCATIWDLKKINCVVKRIRAKPNKGLFTKVGSKEDLMVFSMSDASFKMDDQSISGILVLLGNRKNDRAVPVFWKSKMIIKVCHLVKAAEMWSMIKVVDNIQFFTIQLEQLLFRSYQKRIPIKLYTDSKPLLEAVRSIHQVEENLLRTSILDMKDVLYDGGVQLFSWLNREKYIVADVMTKECWANEDLETIILENQFHLAKNEDNIVRCQEGKIKIANKHNKE